MRALPVLLALAAVLALAAPAAAEGDERIQRLHVGVGHPGPGVEARVFEHPDCVFHQVVWAGAWFTVADAAVWAWEDQSPSGAGALKNRLQATTFVAAMHGVGWVVTALQQWPQWNDKPALALAWGAGTVGDEDVCALGVAEVTTGA